MSSFERNIQQWVSLDNQIKKLNEQAKELREKKDELCNNILEYADSNNMRENVIQISDGKLRFVETKVQQPLSFKYVEKALGEIIKNEEQVKKIVAYLKQNRESKTESEIKRYYKN